MTVLPDILAPHLTVVFCGTVVGKRSAERGHYYAGPGNAFWELLHDSGLSPRRLSPEEDATLPTYGFGLTDLAKNRAQSHDRGLTFDVATLVIKVERYRPRWLAFTSKKAGQEAARALGYPPPGLGRAPWVIAYSAVFVLPSPSAANRRHEYDGRATRLEWWTEFAHLTLGS